MVINNTNKYNPISLSSGHNIIEINNAGSGYTEAILPGSCHIGDRVSITVNGDNYHNFIVNVYTYDYIYELKIGSSANFIHAGDRWLVYEYYNTVVTEVEHIAMEASNVSFRSR